MTTRMTVNAWKEQTNPRTLLNRLGKKATPRKLRLFACACARRVWHLIKSQACQKAVIQAEKAADNLITFDQLRAIAQSTYIARHEGDSNRNYAEERACLDAGTAAANCAWATEALHNAHIVARQAATAEAWFAASKVPPWELQSEVWSQGLREAEESQCNALREMFHPFKGAKLDPYWLEWNNGTVPALAHTIYHEKRFEEMPILGDALEDAGCENELLLSHCREETEHFRGCWILDLILKFD